MRGAHQEQGSASSILHPSRPLLEARGRISPKLSLAASVGEYPQSVASVSDCVAHHHSGSVADASLDA